MPVTLDKAFIKKWVIPFYMASFSHLAEEDERKFIEVFPHISSEIVAKLLGDFNWRTRIVGAYFAALKELIEFEEIIGNLLLKSEVCFAGTGYCLALASFGTEKGIEFLKSYLDYYLTRKDLWFDQQEVLAALFWLNKNEAEKYQTMWNVFVENKSQWDEEKFGKSFAKSMQTLEHIKKSAL